MAVIRISGPGTANVCIKNVFLFLQKEKKNKQREKREIREKED